MRNALSSCPGWQVDDGAFLGVPFYNSIINLFKDDAEWAYETLCWWNTYVNVTLYLKAACIHRRRTFQLGLWPHISISPKV